MQLAAIPVNSHLSLSCSFSFIFFSIFLFICFSFLMEKMGRLFASLQKKIFSTILYEVGCQNCQDKWLSMDPHPIVNSLFSE
jgi:hypothetical protein